MTQPPAYLSSLYTLVPLSRLQLDIPESYLEQVDTRSSPVLERKRKRWSVNVQWEGSSVPLGDCRVARLQGMNALSSPRCVRRCGRGEIAFGKPRGYELGHMSVYSTLEKKQSNSSPKSPHASLHLKRSLGFNLAALPKAYRITK